MKSIDIEKLGDLPGKRIKDNDTFSFQCHSGLSCFNLCCRNLNLFLYPYDVIRLKNSLKISSDRFIDEYVDILLKPSDYFPEVLLKMREDADKRCPFLGESGCMVYPDRPDTCRTFPVEQGIILEQEQKKAIPVHFFRPPDFCLGRHEKKTWTTKTWAKDQDAILYNMMTAKWAEIKSLFQADPWGREGNKGPRAKMAFMAAYNIDIFRDFLFNSSFLKRYKVNNKIKKKIKKDDVELMKLGFEWIKFYIWGIKTKSFTPRHPA
ncbi:MAG: YkgJ family cysteine cluster protein [Deltaproteobacteria bacterium]|nr:YkgJ family cysteine cluster protein [Deltaproteobacteria bacterium]